MAHWSNEVQRAAQDTPHGIPVTLSTDPRHSFTENWGASFNSGYLSAWPEPIGLGALGDEDVVREFANIARQEYLALGIRSALHPTLDVATEPRWARQYSTFGQDAGLVGRLGVAYIDGFEHGTTLGRHSVACMAKHFPGGGPQRDGEDPHFPYGREQDYPGGRFEYHLEPFRQAIARGVPAIMPSYGIPKGLQLDGHPVEEVGFAFNRQIITGLLREELGFAGVICTDWSIITESRIGDAHLPARAWGVEHFSALERTFRVLEAGADQLGGEDDPELIIQLVESGRVSERRIDESVRRLLRVKFDLGLFEDPFVDEGAADAIVGSPAFRSAGRRAQARSTTIVRNGSSSSAPVLPIPSGTRVFSEEIPTASLEGAGLVPVNSPEDAAVVIVRCRTPFEPRDGFLLEDSFRAGTLEFDADFVGTIEELAAFAPVVLVLHLERPAVLVPLLRHTAAIIGVYGASDDAVLTILTGAEQARGVLPFDLPSSMAAVRAGRPDVPGDTREPLFRQGHAVRGNEPVTLR
jgi:beta-glucosidase